MIAEPITVQTSEGPAAVRVHPSAQDTRGTIVLGHGAGGPLGSWPKDLQSVLTATAHGWTVVLVEQPWRLAGRKVASRPPTLDAAWTELLSALDTGLDAGHTGLDTGLDAGPAGLSALRHPLPRPLVVGGRSAGARVACRTSPGDPDAGLPRADGVLCLSFPLHPPGGPDKSRSAELATPINLTIPTLVVQGGADPFGSPAEILVALAAGIEGRPLDTASLDLVEVPGNHSPSRDQDLVTHSVMSWLEQLG
ncbi:hypothetical protein FNH13_05845 [Ornithinimicrobium ciconiae]|uniref:KANL3/Tex30 alpha/beta hydrolase-like domain-containing protein n=1 Tax=Ornithinimicrobium ciconiae TaxID=2594265 RepID=A0A516G8S0_9MICO|nr:alpha/beta family hydrolase [Ornithinimicrobium ciconiae]QDO87926.1 hypothetical protein FNH13_05845 [Ornithinimicrobium ciconiae]